MRKYVADVLEIDELQIEEDDETLRVPAVIAREIVQKYGDDRVYKPREELEKATFTAENAWVTEDHPTEVILTNPKDIRGTVRNPAFVEDRIKGELVFLKDRCSPKFLQGIRDGQARSVSIGFFYDLVPEPGEFNGEAYDYIQKDILIDHVAVGSWQGRCGYPVCGIGVDKLFTADPWEETEEYIRSGHRNPDEFQPNSFRTIWISEEEGIKAVIGKPKGKQTTEVQSYLFIKEKNWTLSKAKAWFKEHAGDTVTVDQELEEKREAAEARAKKYGIAVKEGGHLTPPEGYPQDEDDYGDPVNYKYPLVSQDRCQNALARWGQFREEYTQSERNVIYERIVRRALKYDIAVKYNPDLPEARALPTAVKEKLEGFESAADVTCRVKALIKEL